MYRGLSCSTEDPDLDDPKSGVRNTEIQVLTPILSTISTSYNYRNKFV